jgi:hypothetical protein
MNIIRSKGLACALVLVAIGLSLPGCNTTKETFDTFAKFTSSTSPGDWINADGLVKDSQKARMFSAVAFENLEQDIARGQGEYLTSLAVLMKVPAAEQEEFKILSQSKYPLLLASDRTAENLLSVLSSKGENQ